MTTSNRLVYFPPGQKVIKVVFKAPTVSNRTESSVLVTKDSVNDTETARSPGPSGGKTPDCY